MEDNIYNNENQPEKKGFGRKIGGCFIKVLGFVATVVCLTCISLCSKTCTRMMINMNQASQKAEYNSKSTIDKVLKNEMEHVRKNLPYKIDYITVAKDVELDDKYFYYILEIDDTKTDLFSVDIQSQKDFHRKNVLKEFSTMKPFVKRLIETNRGLVYRYNAASSDAVKHFVYSKEDLQNMMASNEQ